MPKRGVKPAWVSAKQRVTGIFEEFDVRGRNGRNNRVGSHALQLGLAHHENRPIDLSQGGTPVRAGDGADAGSDGAVRGHLQRSCDHALDVLIWLGILIYATHKLILEFTAVVLLLFVHTNLVG